MASAKFITTTNSMGGNHVLCIVPDCSSAYYPGCGIRFHRFPKDAEKRKRWLQRLNLSPDDSHDKAMLCYLHFHVSDYCDNNPKNKLKAFALPHVSKKPPLSDFGDSDFESIDVEKALDRLKEASSLSDHDSDNNIIEYFTLASSDDEHLGKKEFKKNEVRNKNRKGKKEEYEETKESVHDGQEREQIINEDPDPKLDTGNVLTHVCRICLTTESKMYSIKQYNLHEKYLLFTGITLDMYDESKIPQVLCFECLQRLENFAEFSAKSLMAWSLLMDLSEKDKLTFDNVRNINREQNLLTSNLGFTIYEPNYFDLQIEEYYELDEKNIINEDLNQSMDINIVDDHRNTAVVKINDELDAMEYMKEELRVENFQAELKLERIHTEGDIHEYYTVVDRSRYTNEVQDANVNLNSNKKENTNAFPIQNGISIRNEEPNKDWLPNENGLSFENEQPSEGEYEEQPKGRKNNKRYLKEYNEMFTVKIMTPEEQKAEIESRKNSLSYQNAVFKCYKCFRGFNFEGPFNDHMKRHTNECGEFVCQVCFMHYKTRLSLSSHVRSRHRVYIECRLCPFKSAWKTAAADHKLYHDENRYQCSKCLTTFAKTTSLNDHMQRAHPEDAVCHLCGKSYVGHLMLEKHWRVAHKGEELQLAETCPKCPTCKVRFRDDAALRVHFAVSAGHGKPPKTPKPPGLPLPEDTKTVCIENEPVLGNVTCEQLLANAPYCPTCDIHFLDEAALRVHLTVSPNHGYPPVTPTESPRRPPVSEPAQLIENAPYCPKCDMRFRDEEALSVHLAVSPNHGDPTKAPIQSPKSAPPKRRVWPRRNRGASGPVTCEQCGFFCPNLRTYMKHFGDKHPDRNRTQFSSALPTYMCELCGKIFQNITILNEHRASHSGARPHACAKCPSTFRTKHDLRIHLANHTRSRRCSLCGNVYATVGGLMRHIMIHTGKPYSCEPCNKQFCTPSAKRAHIRHTHLGEPWPKKRPKGEVTRRYRGGKFQSEADMDIEMQMECQSEEQNVLTQYIDEE